MRISLSDVIRSIKVLAEYNHILMLSELKRYINAIFLLALLLAALIIDASTSFLSEKVINDRVTYTKFRTQLRHRLKG